MVADFDFRGMADILGTHIGFLEADFEAKVYTCAGEFGDEPLQCCLAKCVAKAVSSAKSKSRTSAVLTLVLVRRRATLKSLPSGEYGGTLCQESKA